MALRTQNIFQRVKKLPSRTEADGTEAQVEVREDEEQSTKLQEIIDILVAAGYFRARIKGLSSFDKVVGGITWCVQSCSVDVDVDLLFQENSTIGQKISLTEKIVAALIKMKCPHQLEPHQIQGLDFIHIFPVVQWLVKKSMAFREEMAEKVRSYAIMEYQKDFPVVKNNEQQREMLKRANKVKETYRERRCSKYKKNPPENLLERVQITILEYGSRGEIKNTFVNPNIEEEIEDMTQITSRLIIANADDMVGSHSDKINYVELNETEQKQLESHYAVLKSELEDGGIKSKVENTLLELEQNKNILDCKCTELENNTQSLNKKIIDAENKIGDIKTEQKEGQDTLQQLEDIILQQPEKTKEIEELVVLNDKHRQEESQFKEQCKQELLKLQNLIQETEKATTPVESSPDVDQELETENEKTRFLRLQIAKKNRKITALQRNISEVPSRAELAQYQRRFLELYNQVAAKHKETKQYYTLYNTLEDTRMYMRKELSLLNSISDNYPEAMTSSSSKEEFISQMISILEGVRQSKLRLDRSLTDSKANRDRLSDTLRALVELQRRYVVAVRQLSIECKKYESLLAQQKK